MVPPVPAAVTAVGGAAQQAQQTVLPARARAALPDVRADVRAPDLKPCRLCRRTHARRMYALMTHWYGRYVGVPEDHGYFYLCPRCYARFIRVRERRGASET